MKGQTMIDSYELSTIDALIASDSFIPVIYSIIENNHDNVVKPKRCP